MKAHLEITSWAGRVVDAVHFYGRLRVPDQEEITVERTLTVAEAADLNRDERRRGEVSGSYSPGSVTGRFKTEEQVIECAIAYLKANHPEIEWLLNGCSYVLDPQPVVMGPEPLKTELNALVAAAEANDWWEGDENTMSDISKRWRTLAPWRKASEEV